MTKDRERRTGDYSCEIEMLPWSMLLFCVFSTHWNLREQQYRGGQVVGSGIKLPGFSASNPTPTYALNLLFLISPMRTRKQYVKQIHSFKV